MQDCEYYNSVLFSHIKHAVRKATNQAPADILVYDRIQLRSPLNGRQGGIYAQDGGESNSASGRMMRCLFMPSSVFFPSPIPRVTQHQDFGDMNQGVDPTLPSVGL